MRSSIRFSRLLCAAAYAALLLACAGQKDSASKLISAIEASLDAGSAEASKYVPEQLASVEAKLGALRVSYDHKDYAAVVAGAPAVLSAAQALPTAAAAKKDEVLASLNEQWEALSGELPQGLAAVASRIEQLGRRPVKKAAAPDLSSAKRALAEASGLWSKAQAAFATGNLQEAVNTANDLKGKLAALAASLKIELPTRTAPPSRPPTA